MRNGIITSWEQVPIVMDLAFACRILAKSYDRLKKLSQQGNFPAFKAGSEWRVTKDDLIRYIEENKNTAKQKGVQAYEEVYRISKCVKRNSRSVCGRLAGCDWDKL